MDAEARANAAVEYEAKNAARAAQGKEPKSIYLEAVKPEQEAQCNFTSRHSRIMKTSNRIWVRCGNAQSLVDESQLIMAADVLQQTHDVRQVSLQ